MNSERTRGVLAAIALFLLLPLAGLAPPPAESVKALGGQDEAARSLARQYLRHDGAAVVPAVIPLLRDKSPAISRAAFQVLSDIAADVNMPGREADRAAMTDALLPLLAGQETRDNRIDGLKLLTIVAAPDRSLEPIGALLADKDLRERARYALQEIGTAPAAAALAGRLTQDVAGDPDFASALLNSLAQVHDHATLPAVAALVKAENPKVRAAAVRALAWTGDASYLDAARQVLAQADDASKPDAGDAIVRLLEQVAKNEANRPAALAAYRELAGTTQGAVKDSVLAGLGRFGDASCVPVILASLGDASPHTRRAALWALQALPGADTTAALVAAVPGLPAEQQVALLPVLAGRHDASVLPLLSQALASTDEATRSAALQALRATGRAEALEPLKQALTGPQAEAAREQMLALAEAVVRQDAAAAGRGFAAVFDATPAAAKELRKRAVEGIIRFPVPEALAAAKAVAADPDLKPQAIPTLLAVANALSAANRQPEAQELLQIVRSSNPPADILPKLAKALSAAGQGNDASTLLGFVTRWWVVGPFELGENNSGWSTDLLSSEPNVNLVARYMSGKSRVEWKKVQATADGGVLDLRKAIANRDNCLGYAYTEITVEEPTDAVLMLGVDDSEKVWLNGQQVFELFTPRALTPDQDKVPVKLQAGVNRILLKLYQNGQGWEFCLRVVHPDGSPVAFKQKGD